LIKRTSLLALLGGALITMVGVVLGAFGTLYPIFVFTMLPGTLLSFPLWGGPESTSPRADDPALHAIVYAANALVWAAILWLPALLLSRRSFHRQKSVA
jgi:hypothetical protein